MMAKASNNTTSDVVNKDEDVLNCPICLEILRKPKTLPCLHTFCESCLGAYILSSVNGKDHIESFQCPVCRQNVKSPDPNAAVENWACLLPDNERIMKLLDSSVTQYNESGCGPCSRGGENSTGQFWCYECSDCLCETCKKFHDRVKSLKNHTVVDLKKVGEREVPRSNTEVEEACSEHGEILKVYCLNHLKICCVMCLALNHRECKNIKTFDSMLEEIGEVDVNNICKKLQNITLTLGTVQQRKRENLEQLCTKQQATRNQVSALVKDTKAKLDQYFKEFESKLAQVHKISTAKLSEKIDVLDNVRKTVNTSQNSIKSLSKHGMTKQLFVLIEKVKCQLGNLIEPLQKKLTEVGHLDYKLDINDKFTNLNELADVKVVSSSLEQSLTPLNEAVQSYFKESKYRDPLIGADISDLEAVKLWDVKETSGWYTGGAFHQDGTLTFADSRNETLVTYDREGHTLNYHDLDYVPWDVVTNLVQLFVSDFKFGFIHVYDICLSSLRFCYKIKTADGYNIRGFDVCENELIIGSGLQLKVFELSGKLLSTFSTEHNILYVCSSPNEAKFYYCSGDEVVCKSKSNLKSLNVFSFRTMKEPRGIAIDTCGNVYIAGMMSKTLHVVSKDGQGNRILISNFAGITKPYAVGFDRNNTHLFVTAYKEDCNNKDTCAEIYRLRIEK